MHAAVSVVRWYALYLFVCGVACGVLFGLWCLYCWAHITWIRYQIRRATNRLLRRLREAGVL